MRESHPTPSSPLNVVEESVRVDVSLEDVLYLVGVGTPVFGPIKLWTSGRRGILKPLFTDKPLFTN